MTPHVSIVVPAFRRPAELSEALQSVARQTFRDWECIVAIDDDTAETRAVVDALNDGRFVRVDVRNGGSPGRTRNEGLGHARGEWVAFLDDDDRWRPNKLEEQLSVARRNNAGLVFSKVERFGDEFGPWPGESVAGQLTLQRLLRRNVIPCSSVLVRRAIVERIGGFNSQRRIGEDYELWLRIVRSERAFGIDDLLVEYRVHAGGITKREDGELRELAALYRELAREWRLSPLWLLPARWQLVRRRLRRAFGTVGR